MSYEVAEAESSDQIVITLHEEKGADVFIRSVDFFVSSMKVRVSARSTSSVESVFHRDIARLIRRICGTATLSKQIINVPDFCMRLRGLGIKGYTLLVHTLETGLRQFIIRLKRATGNAFALFRDQDQAASGLSIFPGEAFGKPKNGVRSDRLFDEMLSHLYLPLVNLNNYLRNVLDGEQNASAEPLSTSVVQLKTKAEVLQFAFDRLISEIMLARYVAEDEVSPPADVKAVAYQAD